MIPLHVVAALVAAQWLPTGIAIKDEGVAKGTATSVNCVGAGVTCSVAAGMATFTVTAGGGGAPGGVSGNLQTNNGAGGFGAYGATGSPPANQWLQSLDASGTATWAQVDWANLSGKPATFPATTPVATATALAADGADCSSGQAALGVSATGAAQGCWTVQQPASTTALKAGTVGGAFADYAGSTCGAGQAPLGLTAAGAVTGCFTPAGTYSLPDAAAATKGGLQLAGDLGGTAASPTVPGLSSRSGTGACGSNAWASTLNGAAAPTCTQPAFSNLSGSATAAQIPTASTTLGGVKQAAACGAGNHVSSIVAGELTCTADAAGVGGGNAVTVSVDLGTGGVGVYTITVTGQAWVTGSSKVLCAPQGTSADGQTVETYYVAGLQAVVANLSAGVGFDLAVYSPLGATGVFRFACQGV